MVNLHKLKRNSKTWQFWLRVCFLPLYLPLFALMLFGEIAKNIADCIDDFLPKIPNTQK